MTQLIYDYLVMNIANPFIEQSYLNQQWLCIRKQGLKIRGGNDIKMISSI